MTTAQFNLSSPQSPVFNSAEAVPVFHRSLRRTLLHRWELFMVLTLIGSSAITGVFLLFDLAF